MPIVSYVPRESAIRDRRKPDGGYYNAKCDVCGREFYPSRSNAKYCSQVCSQMAYRKRLLSNPKKEAEMGVMLRGTKKKISDYFKLYRLKTYVNDILKNMNAGEICCPVYDNEAKLTKGQISILEEYTIEKVGPRTFVLTKK